VSPATESIEFERSVVEQMGNDVVSVSSAGDAVIRLRAGERFDLIVIDETAKGVDFRRLEALLVRGLVTHPQVAFEQVSRIGPSLRLIILVGKGARGKKMAWLNREIDTLPEADRVPIRKNFVVVEDIYRLQERIDWLQTPAVIVPQAPGGAD
jgi:CheY-like chemotaxis protein